MAASMRGFSSALLDSPVEQQRPGRASGFDFGLRAWSTELFLFGPRGLFLLGVQQPEGEDCAVRVCEWDRGASFAYSAANPTISLNPLDSADRAGSEDHMVSQEERQRGRREREEGGGGLERGERLIDSRERFGETGWARNRAGAS